MYKMLSHINHLVPTSVPWSYHHIKPVNSFAVNDDISITEYFTSLGDTDNILHLLQDGSNDFDIDNCGIGLLISLLDFPFAPRQYKLLGDIMYLSMESAEDACILYKCYQVTNDSIYRDNIVTCGYCYAVNDPLIPVTVKRVNNVLMEMGGGPELLYLFNLLSLEEQDTFIQELDLSNLITECDVNMLARILDKVTHSEYYRIAYALVHKSSLPFTEDALQPAEYFIARKYTNWNGVLLTTNKRCLSAVIDTLASKDDKELIDYMNQYVKPKIVLHRRIQRDL